MTFDYKATGLPDNPKWQAAAEMCHAWLSQHMSMFGQDGIARFMRDQPLAAAQRIIDNCLDWSEESVTLALLGPAKGDALAAEALSRRVFGDRTVEILNAMADERKPRDAAMKRDLNRLFIVEGISTMNDQMVGRKRIDAHHQTRWRILGSLQAEFAKVKGQNPKLDVVFEEAMRQSKDALNALDKAAAAKKTPKPPGL